MMDSEPTVSGSFPLAIADIFLLVHIDISFCSAPLSFRWFSLGVKLEVSKSRRRIPCFLDDIVPHGSTFFSSQMFAVRFSCENH